MNSSRLNKLAELVEKGSFIVDVGCDHAYLPILLIENGICDKAYASDISKGALENAKNNIKKHSLDDKIQLFLSDGLKDVPSDYDTIVISGMGTKTVKHILDNIPDKTIIISSNNNHYELRNFMQHKGFKIDLEDVVYENGKYYPIIRYKKGNDYLNEEELYFGKSSSKEYFQYLYNKYKSILDNMPNNKDNLIDKKVTILEKLLKKNR